MALDLVAFSDELLHAVEGIVGDRIVESHEQAALVLDAVMRKPGRGRQEVAAVLGVTAEQLARAQAKGDEETTHELYAEMCKMDATYTWNMLIQRVNQAAHWQEEFRDMCLEDVAGDDESETVETAALDDVENDILASAAGGEAPPSARSQARDMLLKRLEAAPSESLRRKLAERLEGELFEHCPANREYRAQVRSVAANLRRNLVLASSFAAGRIPPQWLVEAHFSALAPRITQLQRKTVQAESLKEALQDEDVAKTKRKANLAGQGANLAPPPPISYSIA